MTKVLANGADLAALHVPGLVVGLRRHRAARLQAEAEPVLLAEGDEQADVDVVDLVALDHGRAVRPRRCASPRLHLVEAVAVVDRLEDGRVGPQQRLVLELEVLGEGQHDLTRPCAGDLVVPVEDVLLDGDRGEGGRVDLVGDPAQHVGGRGDDPARRRAGGDDGRPEHRRPTPGTALPGAAGPAAGRPGEPVAGTPASTGRVDRADSSRSAIGRQAHTTASPPSSATFVPNSVRLWGHQQRAGHGDEEAEHDPAAAAGGHGLRVRDHEEQEDRGSRAR